MEPISIIYLALTCVGVVILSGLFSMIEIAIFTSPLSKINSEIENGNEAAKVLLELKQKTDDSVAAIVIMNNIVNIGGSLVIGQLVQAYLKDHQFIGITANILVVCSVIVFGEILPKNIGETHNVKIALKVATFINILIKILYVPIKLMSYITKFVRPEVSSLTSEDEIKDLVNLGGKSGAIENYEGEIITRIFNLNDITAKDIMTHRVHMSSLDETTKILEITAEDLNDLHSRIVIYDDNLDKITGLVLQRDILLAHAEGKEILTLKEISHACHTVYENVTAQHLLELFKKTRQHLFVVIDEEGGTSGVVTLEDVLEEIVGEIHDETDDENEDKIKEEVKEGRLAEMNVLELPGESDHPDANVPAENSSLQEVANSTNNLENTEEVPISQRGA